MITIGTTGYIKEVNASQNDRPNEVAFTVEGDRSLLRVFRGHSGTPIAPLLGKHVRVTINLEVIDETGTTTAS